MSTETKKPVNPDASGSASQQSIVPADQTTKNVDDAQLDDATLDAVAGGTTMSQTVKDRLSSAAKTL